MSRKERHSRSSGSRKGRLSEGTSGSLGSANEEGGAKLPPRRKKFPSSLHKLNKWYYNLLFVLFLGLVIFLFWYGNKFSS
ncbi:hypothetical protein B1748_06255 [Paenibacillus sp. MY03]|jgi:hypothetical protein|uniref:hypothetical protein n=1 Tax=Paenibacillus TaxID=44249 RepID=UPI000B3D3E9A|nr:MULTISPECIES: hypothetical protein [Paenibacillus]OUS77402.1 hypothetical protein B1748_06255 [Paenibacillus sp. MY03]